MTLFLITAPSGAGKTTIASKIKKWGECISHTTRPMRDGEVEGVTYYYVNKGQFEAMDSFDEFVETVEYDGNSYGLTKVEVERVMSKNLHAYVIVEHNGYKQIKEKYPDAVGIFLHMSKEDCMANMLLRGDSLDKALARIAKYDEEMKNRDDYDYVIKNVRGKDGNVATIIENIIYSHYKQ